ncbi:MAG: hypothetical protein A2V70_05985 [Planctomycetes bacterium RBG_13_63_9]|nr:MAG: hypothetical protein A2V70_05985 [Planctomycetes bacterium RBG_13_63_9]
MNVRVQLFAGARQAAGRGLIELQLAEEATIGELRRRLAAEIPPMAGLLQRSMFAIDAEFVDDRQEIPAGADVACIPPVSGG